MSDENPVESGQVPNEGPFYRDTINGQTVEYRTPEELKNAFRDNFMMRADYTRKTQDVAEQRKQIETMEKEFKDREKQLAEKQREFERYDRFVQEHPDAYQYLRERLTAPPDANVAYQRAQGYTDEKMQSLQQELEDFKAWREQLEMDQEKQTVYASIAKENPDFNAEMVDAMLNEWGSGGLEALARGAYLAARAKNPVDQQMRAQQTAADKAAAKTTSGGGAPPKQERQFSSFDEAARVIERELGGIGGG